MSPRAKEYEHETRSSSIVTTKSFATFASEWIKRTAAWFGAEVEYGDEIYALIRFDTADDGFHQHDLGIREPSPERFYLPGVPSDHWIDYAIGEIERRYRDWELKVGAPWLLVTGKDR